MLRLPFGRRKLAVVRALLAVLGAAGDGCARGAVAAGLLGVGPVEPRDVEDPTYGRLPHDDGEQDAGVLLPSDAPDDVDAGPGGGGGVLPMGEADAGRIGDGTGAVTQSGAHVRRSGCPLSI